MVNVLGTGIDLREIMAFMTALTFFIILLSCVESVPGQPFNFRYDLIPEKTIYIFNLMYIDDFNFFNSEKKGTCLGLADELSVYASGATNPSFQELLTFMIEWPGRAVFGCGLRGLGLIVGLSIIAYWTLELVKVSGSFMQLLDPVFRLMGWIIK